jgi:hypothetical protein
VAREEQKERSPVERTIARSLEDEEAGGKPLSRRARQTKRSVESYIRGGSLPRYIERQREIERETVNERTRVERLYRLLHRTHGHDPAEFARRWRARARPLDFSRVNELIRQHNEWYPIESGLPMDPRTRDYVRIRGKSYTREPLGEEWVLALFPPEPARRPPQSR